MIGLVAGAGILGIIVAVMEEGSFPNWGKMTPCVLTAILPTALINALLPPGFFFVGLTIGAMCAGLAISYFTGMSVKRASIAAGIYLALQMALSFVLMLLTR